MTTNFTGVIAASVTPFDSEGALDIPALEKHLDFLIDGGVDGVLAAGTSGEFNALTAKDLQELYESTVCRISGQATALAGIIELSSSRARHVAKIAMDAKVDALLVSPPFFIKPSLEGISDYFQMIGDETGLPIILYNNPGRLGWSIDAFVLEKLVENQYVVGIKDCERDIGLITEKIELFSSRISVLSGDDDLGYPTVLCGANGGVWAGPNLFPRVYCAMFEAAKGGDTEVGMRLHKVICALGRAWFTTNHPGPLKTALELLDRPAGSTRPPMASTSLESRRNLQAALEKAEERLSTIAYAGKSET